MAAALASLLTACASTNDAPLTVFADPGKYQYYSCEQMAKERQSLTQRQKDLKSLMDKADETAGGAAVGILAYKSDYVAANEDRQVLESTARSKNCTANETLQSNGVIR